MKRIIVSIALFLSVLGLSAYDFPLEIYNDTGYDITELYISPVESDSWEEDIMEGDILYDGDSLSIDITGYDTREFDIMLVDEDGDTYTLYNQTLKPGKTNKLEFTIADLDMESADYEVMITNSTGYTITELYISPDNSDSWEEELLEGDDLEDGYYITYTLSDYETDVFDILAIDEDGDTITLYGQTLDEYDVVEIELTAYDYDE